ncbi:pyridoxal phosphate-dependent decarboxylase family protein [Streptomyces sp. SBT349]|uniref:pyridoxal phosphate-dependent decarboxylase family protein n=1 Tax=Streptomyces sp. SBT349 TaxID=1580539 RepID=UPI00066CC961|nr:aminotransferase class V-fold PLP-dependent enzyme [Streptomyces sp. SBT349]
MDEGGAESRLAGGTAGHRALRPYVEVVLDALADGAARRAGPLPRGGPDVARRLVDAAPAIPEHGEDGSAVLRGLVRAVAEGAADPADPHCVAHLHSPPLAIAVAADLAASALNCSLDSWDQAPAASELEVATCRSLHREVFPGSPGGDVLVTSGSTESNMLGLLLARESRGPETAVICGENAHHSVHRAAWLLGMRAPRVLPTPRGVLDPDAARAELGRDGGRALLVATAGTTDTGAIDPLEELAVAARDHGARLHVDAAYGGLLLFSTRLRHLVRGLDRADTVALDFHKLGWQPAAAGAFAVREDADLVHLKSQVDYLNAVDDTDAGIPSLLERSTRTTRRADILKIAVTLRALGRGGIGELIEKVRDRAMDLAALVSDRPELELHAPPGISTVLFRPVGAADAHVAELRRCLLSEGKAVLGRADAAGRLWLKVTLLNPHAVTGDLETLLKLVVDTSRRLASPREDTPTAGA